jgi:hypothetical protein
MCSALVSWLSRDLLIEPASMVGSLGSKVRKGILDDVAPTLLNLRLKLCHPTEKSARDCKKAGVLQAGVFRHFHVVGSNAYQNEAKYDSRIPRHDLRRESVCKRRLEITILTLPIRTTGSSS